MSTYGSVEKQWPTGAYEPGDQAVLDDPQTEPMETHLNLTEECPAAMWHMKASKQLRPGTRWAPWA